MENRERTTAQDFDQNLSTWKSEQQTPWARLRYRVLLNNLDRHLGPPPQRILDVGGGSGPEAIPLAQQGHAVTIVDFAAEMLAEAERAAATAGVLERIRLHRAEVADLSIDFPAPTFDAALCHNVVQYVADVDGMLRAIHQALRPGGFLSIGSVNPYSEAYAAALRQMDPAAALQKIDTRSKTAEIFDVTHPLFAPEEMASALEASGYVVEKQYGVRCVNDYIADNDIKSDPDFFAQLEQLELALTDRYPYYLLARMYQLIARKPA